MTCTETAFPFCPSVWVSKRNVRPRKHHSLRPASGLHRKEVREKEQEIIDFSELGDFIDKPVRTYSSGMYSKLAFSITAILETDIMLIDEVLSVGDQKFKKKATKMKSLISDKSRTVLIVSHNISTLQELCDTIMWMHDGEIRRIGEPEPVLAEYMEFMDAIKMRELSQHHAPRYHRRCFLQQLLILFFFRVILLRGGFQRIHLGIFHTFETSFWKKIFTVINKSFKSSRKE